MTVDLPPITKVAHKRRPSYARMRCPGCGEGFQVPDDADPDRILERHAEGSCDRPDGRLLERLRSERETKLRWIEERRAARRATDGRR